MNKKLMALYKEETGAAPTYFKAGATYHTLRYVEWLERRAASELAKRPSPALVTEHLADHGYVSVRDKERVLHLLTLLRPSPALVTEYLADHGYVSVRDKERVAHLLTILAK